MPLDLPNSDASSSAPTLMQNVEYIRDMLFELAKIADTARSLALHASIVAAYSVAVEHHGRLSAVAGDGLAPKGMLG